MCGSMAQDEKCETSEDQHAAVGRSSFFCYGCVCVAKSLFTHMCFDIFCQDHLRLPTLSTGDV